jgi:2-hydroxychromene-2-carboxylate isomerase
MTHSSPQVEFFFDFGSPTTYFAFHVLPQIAERRHADIVWRPVLLGGVFKLSNNSTPAMHPLKARWMMQDLARWADFWQVPFRPGPIPMSTLQLVRCATHLLGQPRFMTYCTAVFNAMWRDGADFNDPATLPRLLADKGFDPIELLAQSNSPQIKDSLTRTTQELVERGGFGAPTMFVGDEMHFGQDRLLFVEKALSRLFGSQL